MKLTTKGRYAVTAMMDLALHARIAPVALAEIANRQHISLAYLEQLFGCLRRAGLVDSVRGPKGGYHLASDPMTISLASILVAADEEINLTCGGGTECSNDDPCLTHGLWNNLSAELYAFLDEKKLGDLIRSRYVQAKATEQDVSQIGDIPVTINQGVPHG